MLAKFLNSFNLTATSTALSLFIIGANLPVKDAIAVALRTVSTQQAINGTVTIAVWAGVGQNIFLPKGEKIQKVWLDDPSRIVLDFDVPLCSAGKDDCDGSGANVIHLKRIHPLNFEQLPKTGSTLLTVITDRNRYLFRLTYGTGNPQYSAVEIAAPPAQRDLNAELFQVSVEKGLAIAQQQGLIGESQKNTALIGRVEMFLFLHKSGLTLPDAAKTAGISLNLVSKLSEMGRTAFLGNSSPLQKIANPTDKTEPINTPADAQGNIPPEVKGGSLTEPNNNPADVQDNLETTQ